MWQVWSEKANASEPSMTRRYASIDIKTGGWWNLRDEPGRCLSMVLAVSGV